MNKVTGVIIASAVGLMFATHAFAEGEAAAPAGDTATKGDHACSGKGGCKGAKHKGGKHACKGAKKKDAEKAPEKAE